jgi:hypothetical protein
MVSSEENPQRAASTLETREIKIDDSRALHVAYLSQDAIKSAIMRTLGENVTLALFSAGTAIVTASYSLGYLRSYLQGAVSPMLYQAIATEIVGIALIATGVAMAYAWLQNSQKTMKAWVVAFIPTAITLGIYLVRHLSSHELKAVTAMLHLSAITAIAATALLVGAYSFNAKCSRQMKSLTVDPVAKIEEARSNVSDDTWEVIQDSIPEPGAPIKPSQYVHPLVPVAKYEIFTPEERQALLKRHLALFVRSTFNTTLTPQTLSSFAFTLGDITPTTLDHLFGDIPIVIQESGLGCSESSRGSAIVSSPMLETWGDLRSPNPGALAQPKHQFLNRDRYNSQGQNKSRILINHFKTVCASFANSDSPYTFRIPQNDRMKIAHHSRFQQFASSMSDLMVKLIDNPDMDLGTLPLSDY